MERKKCQATRRKELFYYVTSSSNVTRDVHWYVTVDYQQIANGKIANQIHGFTIDYGKFILIGYIIHNSVATPSPPPPRLLFSTPPHPQKEAILSVHGSVQSHSTPPCQHRSGSPPFWKLLLARTEFSISTCKQPCSSQSREIKTTWTQRNLKSVSLCV